MTKSPLTHVLSFTRRKTANCLPSETLMRRLKPCGVISDKRLFLLHIAPAAIMTG
jgi:hypothetical protein